MKTITIFFLARKTIRTLQDRASSLAASSSLAATCLKGLSLFYVFFFFFQRFPVSPIADLIASSFNLRVFVEICDLIALLFFSYSAFPDRGSQNLRIISKRIPFILFFIFKSKNEWKTQALRSEGPRPRLRVEEQFYLKYSILFDFLLDSVANDIKSTLDEILNSVFIGQEYF